MAKNIVVLKTQEITDDVWAQICEGYKVCFDVHHTPEQFKQSFSMSVTGYTLHALKFAENGELMGHNYFQPRPYVLNGRKVMLALSGGTFVMPAYRKDIFLFGDLYKALCKESQRLGWIAQLGVPNENSYPYCVKFLKQKYLGDLNYYIMPVHAGTALHRKNALLDGLSSVYAHVWSWLAVGTTSLFNFKEKMKPLHMDGSQEYLDVRLKHENYSFLRKGNIQVAYVLWDEEGIQTAYIVDCREGDCRSAKALALGVRHIVTHEKVDAILYVGTMNVCQHVLTKVPIRFVPHRLTLCVDVFDKNDKELQQVFSSMDNLDYGLLNFDVR
jgi:hypothetical protein